jgi:uncharacterized protein YjbJ (UPF0337 family)
MTEEDKARNRRQNLRGKAKRFWGRVSDDPALEAEGHADERKADLKQAGEKLKDALRPKRQPRR